MAICALTTFVGASIQAHAGTGGEPAITGGGQEASAPTCTGVKQKRVRYIRLNGESALQPSADTATFYDFNFDGDNSTLTMVTPPTGWKPTIGTDDELSLFGFPPRPTDPSALADWTSTYSHWKGAAAPGMCRTKQSSATYAESTNWSGEIDTNASTSYFKTAVGSFEQPTFLAACDHASAHGIWSGIGGWLNNRLLQAGTDVVGSSGLNDDYGWWEAARENGTDTYQVKFANWSASAGDTVQASVTYSPASPSQVTFQVFDVTSGQSAGVTSIQILGRPPSDFYNGSTAEYVDERTAGATAYPVDGKYYYFRKVASPYYVYWHGAYSNGAPAVSGSRTIAKMVRPNGTTLGDVEERSSTAFRNNWRACA